MDDKPTLLQFPCDFPLKIIGNYSMTLVEEICQIIYKHFPQTPKTAIRSKLSQHGNYVAITVVLFVNNQQELDALYLELTAHPEIKMVL